MAQVFRKLKLANAFWNLVKDPAQTEQLFFILESARHHKSPLLQTALKSICSQKGLSELYEERFNPKLPPVADLLKLPENSFGHALGRHMSSNNLDFDFYPIADGTTEQEYAVNRIRKMHDLWHVLTGFGVSIADEIGLQGFTLAQIRSPFSAMIIAGGILHSITRKPVIFNDLIEQLFRGYQMGIECESLAAVKVENCLQEDLENLRVQFGIMAKIQPAKAA